MRETLEIHARRVSTGKSHFRGHSALIRVEAPADEVEALFEQLAAIRGIHRVEVRWNSGEVAFGDYFDSPWRTVYVRGTERAQRGAANLLAMSGLVETDENADHDHARCLADAQKAGVPASYAHMIETYLSM